MSSFRLTQDEVSSHQNQLMTSLTLGPREEEPSSVPRPSPSPHPQNIQVTDLGQVYVNISWHLSARSTVTYHIFSH